MLRHLVALSMLASTTTFAAEGMWTLDNLPTARMQERYGFTPPAGWVDKVMKSSARLAGGCSGSFVSADGLVMTNHHCAESCIQQLSTAAKNYTADGFLAKKREEEPRCPEIELNRLEQITDVTAQVQAATAGKDGMAFQQAQDAVSATLKKDCAGGDPKLRCDLVTLYQGGRYQLYKYHKFDDVRLVFAPEFAIAFFGGDPDNFNFPRYNLDVAMLRAYEDGKPAKVKDFFRFAASGAKEGDMAFTVGHPGRTQRQLTVAQLTALRDQFAEDLLPRFFEFRGVLLQYAKAGPEQARTANSLLFRVENGVKVFRGELQALDSPALMATKRAEEDQLKAFVDSRPELKAEVGDAWGEIARAQVAAHDLAPVYSTVGQGTGFQSAYFRYARMLVRGAAERAKPNPQRLREFADSGLPEVEQELKSSAPVYPEFEKVTFGWSLTKLREVLGADDATVKQVLGRESPDALAARLIGATKLGDPAERMKLWTGGQAAIDASDDPFIKLALQVDPQARQVRQQYESQVSAVERKAAERIARARFAQTGTGQYPDATFTLRLSYGEVKGWTERGKPVVPFTQMQGVFDRATGAAPFALPPSWLAAKDRIPAATPFDLVTTNDIIGGNSGSPLINRDAEIIGLIFDGNIHSLGGAFFYDERVNRAVAVDATALTTALSTIYDAKFLSDELLGRRTR